MFEKTKINKKEAGVGPFKKNIFTLIGDASKSKRVYIFTRIKIAKTVPNVGKRLS